MNIIDKTISIFAPRTALNRAVARKQLEAWNFYNGGGYGEHGASRKKNSLKSWNPFSSDADDDIVVNLEFLRARSRDLFMGGANLATGAIKTVRTNVVGSGLMLIAKPDAEFLGLTEKHAIQWKKQAEREFCLWAETVDCDAERRQNFYQLQSLALISCQMSGDVFAVMPMVKRPGSVYDLRIGLIEADRVCNPDNILPQEDANILGGVEIGEYGETVAYWVCNQNPKAPPRSMRQLQKEWKRVPAFGARTGRRNVLHIMSDVERPAQRRGVPMLAPVIESLKQLGRYSEAELMAAVISGMFTVFIKSNSPSTPLGQMFQPDDMAIKDEKNYALGNGAIVAMEEGEEVQIANPGRPNTAFDGFVTALCRQVGAALELPYEVLMKHFTSSYSASRGALLEAWKMFRMRRYWLTTGFCQPIYEEFLTEAILKGRIDAPGFFEDPAIRAAWCSAEWVGDSQGQLDPVKEVNAAKIRVEEGFSTREKEAAEFSGMSFPEINAIRKREEEQRKEAGLIPAAVQVETAPVENGEDDNDDDSDDEK